MENFIGNDVLDVLVNENCLLDVTLEKIEASELENVVTVAFEFKMRPKSDFEKIRLIFSEVEEYGFYYDKNFLFKTVTEIKFFKTIDGNYYLSLDPFFGEHGVISDKDANFVKAQKIEMIVI